MVTREESEKSAATKEQERYATRLSEIGVGIVDCHCERSFW